jgi:hypothetical protein
VKTPELNFYQMDKDQSTRIHTQPIETLNVEGFTKVSKTPELHVTEWKRAEY